MEIHRNILKKLLTKIKKCSIINISKGGGILLDTIHTICEIIESVAVAILSLVTTWQVVKKHKQ